MQDFKIALVVACFHSGRLLNLIANLNMFKLGCPTDIIFVHNKFEVPSHPNRMLRYSWEVDLVDDLIHSFKFPGIKNVIQRHNVGEDMGAYHHAFNLFKDNYTHFFFLNEAAKIHCDDWLQKLHEGYSYAPEVVAISPQVCPSTNHPHCLTSTFWGISSEFGKKMNWPTPTSRMDCEDQEMNLVWPQAKDMNCFVAQVGSGEDILSYKNKHYTVQGIY